MLTGVSLITTWSVVMFGDWNDADWCKFDNYMVGCMQAYLDTGLVKSKFVNLKIRQLSAESSYDFIPDYGPKSRLSISQVRFNKWLTAYAIYKTGAQPEKGRDASGRWIRLKREDEVNVQTSIL